MERSGLTWGQRSGLWLRLLVRLALTLGVVWLLGRWGGQALELTMPFLLGWLMAVLLDPVVRRVEGRGGLSRRAVCLGLILGLVVLVGGGLCLLLYYAGRELMELLQNWDTHFAGFQRTLDGMENLFFRLFALIPPELRSTVVTALEQLLDWVEEAIPRLMGRIGSRAREGVMGLPSFLFALLMFLMGGYFIAADYPMLCDRAARGMSEGMCRVITQVRTTALLAFGGYLRAQLLLSFGVFCILLLGFLVTGQQYSLLLAFALAVLDFIPLLGAGSVMVPWAVLALLTHSYSTAISVAVIWGVVTLYRRGAEPKIVGDQTGLSPILSLFSIYLGLKLGGVLGMVLGPILVLVVRNLCRGGMFRGLLRDVRLAAEDISAILSSGGDDKK